MSRHGNCVLIDISSMSQDYFTALIFLQINLILSSMPLTVMHPFFCSLWPQTVFHFKCCEILKKNGPAISHKSLIKFLMKLVGMLPVFGPCGEKKRLATMIPHWQTLLSLNGLLNDLIKVAQLSSSTRRTSCYLTTAQNFGNNTRWAPLH